MGIEFEIFEPREPECNGICVMGWEVLEGASGVAYPHPDCEKHSPENFVYDYEETCENYVVPREEHDPEALDHDGLTLCGGKLKWISQSHHYNGHYDCITMTLECEHCGTYDVECV